VTLRNRTACVSVIDPFGVIGDPEMPSLSPAMDPAQVQQQLKGSLPRLAGEGGVVYLKEIRVTRYKPRRRCVIEYDVEVERRAAPPEAVVLIGKVRRRRTGKTSHRLLELLWNAGFMSDSKDGISVPEPIGAVPEFRMWLQRKVPGEPATHLLVRPDGALLARRIAEAAHKLHRTGITAKRRHTMADELRILQECMQKVAQAEPRWTGRTEKLLAQCDRLAAATPDPVMCGIHRDFYSDQVIVDRDRLYLIDFDLYCEGDPALDVGNFLGHITEQSLRIQGDPNALADRERALEERFVELSGESTRPALQAYATLTLARHIYLSTLFEERRPFTERLLDLCEERLAAAGCISV
jgi:hypothetical protein